MNAIGYIRISVKDQSTYSLDNQESAVRYYCKQNDLTLLNIFKDDGESSYSFDRPDFNALEKFIRKNKSVQYLIIYDHDRFSRNLAEALMKIKELHDKFNIKVLATTDQFNSDFTDPSAFMMRAFKFMMAESELHKIRSRTQAGYVQACTNGYYVNKAPYGYRNQKINDHPSLMIDEEKAFVVRTIFKEYASGSSIEEIRKLIAAYGYDLKGNSAIQRILTNPTYAGLIKVPAHKDRPERVVPGLHPAIVTEDIYYHCVERLTGNQRIAIHSNKEVWLKGALKGPSGKFMSAGNSKGKAKYYWYYVQQEDRRHLSANTLHRQMNEILDLLSFSKERIAIYERKIGEEIQKHLMSRAEIAAKTIKALRSVDDRISQAEEKWLLQPTSKRAYSKVMTALQSQRTELQKRLNELNQSGQIYWDRLNAALPKLHDIRGTFEGMPLYMQHQFLNMVFDNSLTHDGTTYRTLFLHPIFAHNELTLKEKGLLTVQRPVEVSGLTPVRTAYGSLFEQFFRICDLLAA
jgi:site-specific DNA recombinase